MTSSASVRWHPFDSDLALLARFREHVFDSDSAQLYHPRAMGQRPAQRLFFFFLFALTTRCVIGCDRSTSSGSSVVSTSYAS